MNLLAGPWLSQGLTKILIEGWFSKENERGKKGEVLESCDAAKIVYGVVRLSPHGIFQKEA